MTDEKQHASVLGVNVTNEPEDPKLLRRMLGKCDIRLIPILGSMFLVSFLDRGNIANARIEGFEKDLHMPANGYNTALWIFYVPFILLEVPSNLIMGKDWIKPNIWLGSMMFLLGM